MELSKFVRVIPADTSVILFNTVNACIVELENGYISERHLVKDKLSSEEITYLYDNDFFIDDESALNLFLTTSPNKCLNIILSLTEFCNLCCKYCYETNLTQKCVMDLQLIDKVVQYIASVLKNNSQICEIHFDLIGGEPLLEFDTIQYLLRKMAQFSNLEISYLVETNGTLFNEKVRDLLSHANATIHITLSSKFDHDIMRPYRDGSGSYETILHNLVDSKEFFMDSKHHLYLRYNVHKENMDEFENYMSMLRKKLCYPFNVETAMIINYDYKIGRASCRERV